jgi:hypothetical protein
MWPGPNWIIIKIYSVVCHPRAYGDAKKLSGCAKELIIRARLATLLTDLLFNLLPKLKCMKWERLQIWNLWSRKSNL